MFTGIIQGMFPVVHLEEQTGLKTFEVLLSPELAEGLTLGASVAVDGVCLTVTSCVDHRARFEAMEETLRLTTIGQLQTGDVVNVERSARMGDEIGGHLLSGHVSTTSEILVIDAHEQNVMMRFSVEPKWMRFIFSKGFLALDGASLTVVNAKIDEGTFEVWFIPETLRRTKFGSKKVGDRVNVEVDAQTQRIVETVERMMAERSKDG